MKLCLLCGQMAPADAATCPQDGEASWAADAQARADEPPSDSGEEAPASASPKKRGRK